MCPTLPLFHQALPAVEYSSDLKRWRTAQMVPDLVLLTLVAWYITVSIFDMVKVWRVEAKAAKVTKENL